MKFPGGGWWVLPWLLSSHSVSMKILAYRGIHVRAGRYRQGKLRSYGAYGATARLTSGGEGTEYIVTTETSIVS
jgi:hypothetical protein